MKKIIIFNAVPLNNGDAALVFSLYNSLSKKGFDVKISTHYFSEVKKHYKEYPFIHELTDKKILNKTPLNFFFKPFLVPFLFLFAKDYRKSDVLVACPGGYVNSYYGIMRLIATLLTAKIFRKKVAIYAQSIGPFNKIDKILFKQTAKHIDLILARDEISYKNLSDMKLENTKFIHVEDAAFLIPFEMHYSYTRKIAISVRSWKYDQRNKELYYNLIKSFIKILVENNYSVEFLSTCQGLPNYVNDSHIAKEIIKDLPIEMKKYILINEQYLTLEQLQHKIKSFEAVIGTRLHMCILAMLKGKPAFNISYEVKGSECYQYLGLKEYSIDYNEEMKIAIQKFNYFLQSLQIQRDHLSEVIPRYNKSANANFEKFVSRVLV